MSSLSIATSGLSAASTRLTVAARKATDPELDPADEFFQLVTAKYTFAANAKVMQAT